MNLKKTKLPDTFAFLGQPKRIKVVSIRHGVSDNDLLDFCKAYMDNKEGSMRLNVMDLLSNGKSRTICVDQFGMQIETITTIEKM